MSIGRLCRAIEESAVAYNLSISQLPKMWNNLPFQLSCPVPVVIDPDTVDLVRTRTAVAGQSRADLACHYGDTTER